MQVHVQIKAIQTYLLSANVIWPNSPFKFVNYISKFFKEYSKISLSSPLKACTGDVAEIFAGLFEKCPVQNTLSFLWYFVT
jgi:hypothetical protein